MADSVQPVLLNKGLDTVTPAPMVEPGTLIDCLNYEMTADVGYRRIDGFEAYDGWIGGDIVDYYRVNIDATTDPTVIAALIPGQIITDTTSDTIRGVVLAYQSTGTNVGTLTYAPANNEAPIILNAANLGTTVAGATRFVSTSQAIKGSTTDNADTFVANVRTYSTALRNLIGQYDTPVAGLHYFRNNLVVALDTHRIAYTDTGSSSRNSVQVGSIVGYLTTIYRVVGRINTSGSSSMVINVVPIGTQANNTSLRVYFQDAATISSTSATATDFVVSTNGSEEAYLVRANTPETNEARGATIIPRATWVKYETGTSGTLGIRPGYKIVIRNSAGTGGSYHYVLSHITGMDGSDYTTGNGIGWLELIEREAGWTASNNKLHLQVMDQILVGDAPFSDPGLQVENVVVSQIAGTLALRKKKSRYMGLTANFYGKEQFTEAYLATGASRAARVRAYSDPLTEPPNPPPGVGVIASLDFIDLGWGSIIVQDFDEDPVFGVNVSQVEPEDIPKYVQYHQGSLALGYEKGSVFRSVAGVPNNFSGFMGAMEIATGDAITGLLEAQDNSLIVFGRRAIRRIVGSTDADISMKTLVANAGCFDYTAYNLGSTPVFVGPDGVSSIEQAQEYGDFRGARSTAAVQNTLVPKLITDYSDSEAGGVAMAMICRAKNQYRVFFTTGEVYVVTLTTEGPKVMKSNYKYIPFAWTSELADTMKEHMFVAWDYVAAQNNVQVNGEALPIPNSKRVYELDRGWGFNGVMMEAWFDLAFMFPTKGVQTTSVEKARMFGMSHGYNKLDLKSAGMEKDFEQTYHTAVQDISMPSTTGAYYSTMRPVTAIVDQANWGLGIKLRINNTTAPGSADTEPPVICQVLNLHVRTEGAIDG